MRKIVWAVALAALWGCAAEEAAPNGNGAGGSSTISAGGGGSGGASSLGGSTTAGGSGGSGGAVAVPLDGFGAIEGDCGELDPEELAALAPPFELVNAIDFGTQPYSRNVLSPGGQRLFDDPNAGGSSKESEIIAYEMLYRCELAALLKTETEIVYDTAGVITDMLVEIDQQKTGVSVVRAFKYQADYTVQDALDKMTEKLADIQQSSANVSAADAWGKQILHVIAEKPENAVAVEAALPQIDSATRGDTIVIITVTDGDDAFLY